MIPWKRNKRNSRIIRKLDWRGGQIRLSVYTVDAS
jgi:hypothetical protein